eukprot:CAMPEP_0178395490 /NCGR_PEP_ID=MMETSP0689_2-20121128/13246_1 /TAXON_ID=160604 /ORGANISM="Amphidinium massartii, Strain CS-259" /LENGTH=823 /DNA_ID=CAMNT_0020016147 /DNA_START=51 /DNA_END=2523 /DNA_ORIENTATION=+
MMRQLQLLALGLAAATSLANMPDFDALTPISPQPEGSCSEEQEATGMVMAQLRATRQAKLQQESLVSDDLGEVTQARSSNAPGSHPMAPTCFGFGGVGAACSSAMPGDSGKRRGSSLSSKTLAVKVSLPGCFTKPCWLQRIRVGVDSSNAVASMAKAGVYLSDGTLMAVSEALEMPTSTPDHSWLSFAFRGPAMQLRTLAEEDHVWLVVNPEETVQLTYENVDSEAEATRTVTESYADAFPAMRDWDTEPGRRQWSGTYRNLRMQIDVGDVSILPGTLPLIFEAPHGGRIEEGWPERVSGSILADENTDLFTEELWRELGERCGGRNPAAVILRVHRQGCDANRATGNATLTRPGNEPCSDQSNSQCCCDIPNADDAATAMDLSDVYHDMLAAEVSTMPGALLVPIHATGRHRVEIGARLSKADYNEGAALDPPSLDTHDSDSSLRLLGGATDMIWGPQSLGAFMTANRPAMEILPSPALLCPDANVCPGSSYSSLFTGGHNLKIHVGDTQPGVQLELPQVMRGWGTSPPTPEAAAIKQVAASLAAFLNAHFQETCESDVNFGLSCGANGQASYGVCECNVGYTGASCSECAEGYQQSGGQCIQLVLLAPPDDAVQKYGSAFVTTGSGKRYVYTRKYTTDLTSCGAGCSPMSASLRVRCDSSDCHGDLDGSSYSVGAALYSSSGLKLCEGSSGDQTAQATTDWWLDIPLQSCPLLLDGNQEHAALYLGVWTSKKIKLRWEQEPSPSDGRSRGLQYDTEDYELDPGSQSADGLVDAVPPAQLPSWIDTECVSPTAARRMMMGATASVAARAEVGPHLELATTMA